MPTHTAPPLWPQRAQGTGGDLGVMGERGEVAKALEEFFVGAIAGVAPQAAIGFVGLLVGGAEQGAIVAAREFLPLEVEGGGLAGLARAIAAAVLVDDDAADGFYAGREPEGVVDTEGEIAGLRGGCVADAVIGRGGRRKRGRRVGGGRRGGRGRRRGGGRGLREEGAGEGEGEEGEDAEHGEK